MPTVKDFNPSGIVLTDEQELIVNHEFKKGETVAVKALAGTGKTSSLFFLTNKLLTQDKDIRILYLAFNKSIAEEAKKKFPTRVETRTSHSVAYEYVGKTYRHKLQNTIRLTEITNLFRLPYKTKWDYAILIQGTVNNYICSDKNHMVESMIPKEDVEKEKWKDIKFDDVLKHAKALWGMMKDRDNTRVPMLHDGYLKLFQLDLPDLSDRYDIIMVDEAQDSNPTFIDIVNRQTCAKIWIGDDHQSIYQFRGSINAFSNINIDHTYYLSKSFRFGDEIADMANVILTKCKDYPMPMRGSDIPDMIVESERFDIDGEGQLAIISRTNGSLFINAVMNIIEEDKKVAIVGGAANSGIGTLLDLYYLDNQEKNSIKDKFIKKFKTYTAFNHYVENSKDGSLYTTMKIFENEEYRRRIPHLVNTIFDKTVNIKKADIVLSTAHKCKGLEFDRVLLDDDYYPFPDALNLIRNGKSHVIREFNFQFKIAELNILYVALTRAKKELTINPAMEALIDANKEEIDILISQLHTC
jgi:F-box protein 18 (helicase)